MKRESSAVDPTEDAQSRGLKKVKESGAGCASPSLACAPASSIQVKGLGGSPVLMPAVGFGTYKFKGSGAAQVHAFHLMCIFVLACVRRCASVPHDL